MSDPHDASEVPDATPDDLDGREMVVHVVVVTQGIIILKQTRREGDVRHIERDVKQTSERMYSFVIEPESDRPQLTPEQRAIVTNAAGQGLLDYRRTHQPSTPPPVTVDDADAEGNSALQLALTGKLFGGNGEGGQS